MRQINRMSLRDQEGMRAIRLYRGAHGRSPVVRWFVLLLDLPQEPNGVAALIGTAAPFIQARQENTMDEEIRRRILALLDEHRIMTVATLRPDGWPQATTVGYANEGTHALFSLQPNEPESEEPCAG